MHGKYFDDSIEFLARYIHGQLNGLGELEKPQSLFVGSIGGVEKDEAKTRYPIETFEHRSVEQSEAQLQLLLPKNKVYTFTGFNAFFAQGGLNARNRNAAGVTTPAAFEQRN